MLAPGAIDMADAIFISNVARGATEQAIKEAFEDIAEVKSVTLVKNKQTGQTKGYGFVCFYTKEDKYKALDMTTPPKFKDQVNGRWCSLRIQTADPKNVLFIGSLPKELDEEELRTKLSELGEREVVKFELSVSADRTSRGYGWATYSDHDTALHALKTLQHSNWPDVSFTVAFAKLRTFDERLLAKVKILYVKNIAPEVSGEDIKNLFGAELVEDVVIPQDKESGAPAGHAFVHFKERSDAAEAIHKMQNTMLGGRPISIEWSLPPEAKRTQAEEREAAGGPAMPSPRGPGGRGGGRMGNGAGRGGRRESRSGSDAGGNYPGPYGYSYVEGGQHWEGPSFHEPWKEVGGYEEEQYTPEFGLHHGHGHRHPHPSQMGPHGYHGQRMGQQYMGRGGRHGGQYEMYGGEMGDYSGYDGHMGGYQHQHQHQHQQQPGMGYGGRGRGGRGGRGRRPQPLQQPNTAALEAAMALGMAINQLGQAGASSPPPPSPPPHHSPPGSPMHPQSHSHAHGHYAQGHPHGHPPMSPTHPHVHMHPHSHQHMHHGPPHPHSQMMMHPQAIGHHQAHHHHQSGHHGHHQVHHSPPSSPLSGGHGGHQMHIHLPMVHLSHATPHHGGPPHLQAPPPHHQSPHHSPPHSPHHSPPHTPPHTPPPTPTPTPYGSPHHSPPHSPTHPHHLQNGPHF